MKKIHKRILVLISIASLMLTGCGTRFAKNQYDSDQIIAQSMDKYTKTNSVMNNLGDNITLTVGRFDGRETIWTGDYSGEQDVPIKLTFTLTAGRAKLVHIDEDLNVVTIAECTADAVVAEAINCTIAMKSGRNKLKLVGYDCEDINLSIAEK